MNEKHTNWSVKDFGGATYLDGIEAQYAVMSGEDFVAYAFEAERARLIAAAPELLECLQNAAMNSTGERRARYLAAIAKATGEIQ